MPGSKFPRGVWRYQLLPSDLLMTQMEVKKKTEKVSEESPKWVPGRWIFCHKIRLICVTSSFLTSNYCKSSVVVFEVSFSLLWNSDPIWSQNGWIFFSWYLYGFTFFDTPESLHGWFTWKWDDMMGDSWAPLRRNPGDFVGEGMCWTWGVIRRVYHDHPKLRQGSGIFVAHHHCGSCGSYHRSDQGAWILQEKSWEAFGIF